MSDDRKITRVGERSNPYREALQTLWETPALPKTARQTVLGAAHAAFARQGDELIPPAEIRDLGDVTRLLSPDKELLLYEKCHRWLFVEKKLRPQYYQIILRVLLKHLDQNYGYLAQFYSQQIAATAEMN